MRKSVLVTGSSRGIGKAIALRLARDDYDIVLHCRSRREEADSVARSVVDLGRQARVLQFDVGERLEIGLAGRVKDLRNAFDLNDTFKIVLRRVQSSLCALRHVMIAHFAAVFIHVQCTVSTELARWFILLDLAG